MTKPKPTTQTNTMNAKHGEILAVPTNVITGFLGVGKTSAIINLLKNKSNHERWAVLVNEFGDIGVDGSLFAGQHTEESGVYIKEVPGGCMCCAAGLPMQIALNQLLARARPDRLLIEPTGLGHPLEVLEVLTSNAYRQVLSLQKTVTLVDARKLNNLRYTQHQTFNQQIKIADVIIGNKQDLYTEATKKVLFNYVENHHPDNPQVEFASYGNFDFKLLMGSTFFSTAGTRHNPDAHAHAHVHAVEGSANPQRIPVFESEIPKEGFLKAKNSGEGYQSMGWRFSPDKVFDRAELSKIFARLCREKIERMKAVFITQEGILAYNLTEDGITEFALDDTLESRIELIYQTLDLPIEQLLMNCMIALEEHEFQDISTS